MFIGWLTPLRRGRQWIPAVLLPHFTLSRLWRGSECSPASGRQTQTDKVYSLIVCSKLKNKNQPMEFETIRLKIRPITLADKNEIFEYRSDAETNKYQGWIPRTINDVETFIGKISTKFNEHNTWYQLVIIEKKTKKIIGDIGIHFFDNDNKQVEIGCTLSKDFQNKGYASESIKIVIDYLFKSLNKHRIITSIDPNNENSIRLVERIGFRKEAHFVESLLINGKWVDDLIYALIEKDWDNFELQQLTNHHG